MAQIVISEISQNYTYNIGTNSYATVAMPITSSWGPGFFDAETMGITESEMLDSTSWVRFPATQQGLEAFVSTYRGPSEYYRLAEDYSYQMAMTLLTAGYDVLVCRMCPGTPARADVAGPFMLSAKYPGSFGNKLRVDVYQKQFRAIVDGNIQGEIKTYWNMIVSTVDSSGIKTNLENLAFVTNINDASDNMPYYREVESNFISIKLVSEAEDSSEEFPWVITFEGGSDVISEEAAQNTWQNLIKRRDYAGTVISGYDFEQYRNRFMEVFGGQDPVMQQILGTREWNYTKLVVTDATEETDLSGVFDLLKDKLAYNHNRIITAGWDDQDLKYLDEVAGTETIVNSLPISPLHIKLMDAAYYSRCATAYIDIPRSLARKGVYNEASGPDEGYAQKLARLVPANTAYDVNGALYQTHSALFAPWGRYTYVGTAKQAIACPSFQALMIQRAQILNQAAQYEWALPTNRKHTLRLGKLDYNVPKKLLDKWQTLEGVGVNVITTIPDLGINIWGNSTLFEVPPATYQALANLSTRLLVNAVEDVAYRVGIGITFQYNNGQAYNKFYAGVTPILDTMRNLGAIDDYYVRMSADIDDLGQVNANTVIGKIWLVINGVINDIYVDLIAMPPGTNLDMFRE